MHVSPEKTSFFGFFEEHQSKGSSSANTGALKRKFDSRQHPQREKMYLEGRNFTPMMDSHRSDLLKIYTEKYDQQINEAIASLTRIKKVKKGLKR